MLVVVPAIAIAEVGAQVEGQINAAAMFLKNGNPEQAVTTANRAIASMRLQPAQRLALLNIVAKAETLRASASHFQHVEAAARALETMDNEFPDSREAADARWKLAWLWWRAGDNKQAIVAAREIIARDRHAGNVRAAWLLLARTHIRMERYAYARSDLLQYGLRAADNSREQAEGMAWMAIVDRAESQSEMAFRNLDAVFQHWPDVITGESKLFATYIELLELRGDQQQALRLANRYLRIYTSTAETPLVRLIRANLYAEDKTHIAQAIKEYAILSEQQAETRIGRKAFMRKMMLEFRDESARDKLLPVLMSLRKIASENQLSLIEDEAMLDMARLWTRFAGKGEGSKSRLPALEAYARAAASKSPLIARPAVAEGSQWLVKYIDSFLAQQQWLQAVSSWRHYPQLRPDSRQTQTLRLGIAHALRMLMLFDAAEAMLTELYAENRMSIRGQRIMMELARLWLDRRDADGIKKIMRWLNRHEFSIYRPEMLLIVARMQLLERQAELARRTLKSIHVDDLARESRKDYWLSQAEIAERLSEHHQAARAWHHYRESNGADQAFGLNREADNLFAARAYAEARKLYLSVPEPQREIEWEYHMGVAQMHSGEVSQGRTRLEKLAALAGGKQPDDRFIALAKLALADMQAEKLLGESR